MHLATPHSAILSAVIFNALIIVALIPLALKGVKYEPKAAEPCFAATCCIYGVGGILVPFLGIKAIDMLLRRRAPRLGLLYRATSRKEILMHSTSTLNPVPAMPAIQKNHSVWRTSIRFTLVTTVLLGLGYPLLITLLAAVIFPHKSAGSLILKNGQVIGSELSSQSFTSDRYFHPRPSAAGNGYDATASSGSNLAQSNKALVDRIQAAIDKLAQENPGKPVPIDLVTMSGSGLDPDILLTLPTSRPLASPGPAAWLKIA